MYNEAKMDLYIYGNCLISPAFRLYISRVAYTFKAEGFQISRRS